MQISLKTILLILTITTKTYCQNSPLCPKYDSIRKAWAFVDCKIQKQVLAAEYRQATKNDDDDSEYGKQPYFWSKFNKDNLKILDSIGNSLMAVSKQGLPEIEFIEVINPELFRISWTDTTEEIYGNEPNTSRMINKKGKEWKPKNMPDFTVVYVDSIGTTNYIAKMYCMKNDTLLDGGYMLVDKQCNPLSKVYKYMSGWSKVVDEDNITDVELIRVTNKETHKIGYIDFNGKVIIPEFYNDIYSYFKNDFIILQLDGKYGVLDIKGKTILPFIYQEIRQLENGFFVVKDNNGISNEYVVNAKGERLTEPVFCQIDSFADGKVWQNWSNKTLLYNSKGKCLSSEKEIEDAGFVVFLQDTKTKIFYSRYSEISDKIREFDVILHTPNIYSYQVLQGHLTCRGGRTFRKIIDSKIKFYDSDVILFTEVLNLEKLSIKNTKTGEKKILDELYHIVRLSFYRD